MDCTWYWPHRVGEKMIGTEIDRLFMIDMLANGIPVIENISMNDLFQEMEAAAKEIIFFDVVFYNDQLLFTDEYQNPVIAIKKNSNKLLFFTGTRDAAMDNAATIGKILFLAVSICATNKWMADFGDNTKEEVFEFDSDFI